MNSLLKYHIFVSIKYTRIYSNIHYHLQILIDLKLIIKNVSSPNPIKILYKCQHWEETIFVIE